MECKLSVSREYITTQSATMYVCEIMKQCNMQYVEIVSVNWLSSVGAFHTTSKERLDEGLEQDYGCSMDIY